MRYANWNDYVVADVEQILTPRNTEEVQAIVERARDHGKHLKAIGAGHSFNDLGVGEDLLVDLRHMARILHVDFEQRLVRVQGGMPLHALIAALEPMGLALANLGAWTEQTIAGVISTATHGTSGRYRKTLIGSVEELVLVDGLARRRVLRDDDLRWLTLGFFGLVTEVVLRVEPLFHVRQDNQVLDGAEAIDVIPEQLRRHDFVDMRWAGSERRVMLRRWDIVPKEPGRVDRAVYRAEGLKLAALNGSLRLLRASALPRRVSEGLFRGLGAIYVAQGRGTSHTAVYHQGLTFNSLGLAAPHEEREFAVPMDRALAFLHEARRIILATRSAACLEIQIRFTPAIDVRLAANHGRDTCWFNINVLDPSLDPHVVDQLGQLALDHGARPHWAKVIPARMPRLTQLYADVPRRWEERRRAYDPDGLFLNDWYHRYFGFAPRSLPEQDERE